MLLLPARIDSPVRTYSPHSTSAPAGPYSSPVPLLAVCNICACTHPHARARTHMPFSKAKLAVFPFAHNKASMRVVRGQRAPVGCAVFPSPVVGVKQGSHASGPWRMPFGITGYISSVGALTCTVASQVVSPAASYWQAGFLRPCRQTVLPTPKHVQNLSLPASLHRAQNI